MKEYSAGPIMSELSMFSTLCITEKMEWWSFYRGDAALVEPILLCENYSMARCQLLLGNIEVFLYSLFLI